MKNTKELKEELTKEEIRLEELTEIVHTMDESTEEEVQEVINVFLDEKEMEKEDKGMKVYILIGYIPYSVDNEVEILGVFDSEKGAEKRWEEYSEENGYLQEHEIKEFDVQ